MTPEAAAHFRPANYERYPLFKGFDIIESPGKLHTVYLWHNATVGNEQQPRFFEETTHPHKFVWGRLRMSRDNYNNLLVEGLSIPTPAEHTDYQNENVLFSRIHKQVIIAETTKDDLPPEIQHTRIQRVSTDSPGNAEKHWAYKGVIESLDKSGIIYGEDIMHWRYQLPKERTLQVTRTNKPRR